MKRNRIGGSPLGLGAIEGLGMSSSAHPDR